MLDKHKQTSEKACVKEPGTLPDLPWNRSADTNLYVSDIASVWRNQRHAGGYAT